MKLAIAFIGIFSFGMMFLGSAIALLFFGVGIAMKIFVASALVILFAVIIDQP
jgi:hypothetical protein